MSDSLVARARVLAAYADGRVSVEVLGPQDCRGCGCRAVSTPVERVVELELAAPPTLRRGDELTIAMPARDALRAALWLHGLPWMALLAGSAAGGLTGFGDLGCLLGASAGLAAALMFLWRSRHGAARRALRVLELARID